MSEHLATISWARQSEGFTYTEYNREHEWRFEGGTKVDASAAPAFLGHADRVDPEEAFVASVSSCHMLSFLAICARKKIIADSYEDRAVGHLEKNNDGRLAITRVELSPRISFSGSPPDSETLDAIHEASHRECFIANSVLTDITVRHEK